MNKWKMLVVGVVALTGATLLQGCVVSPAVGPVRPYCYHCYWHRGGCWVNRWGVTHCRYY